MFIHLGLQSLKLVCYVGLLYLAIPFIHYENKTYVLDTIIRHVHMLM